MASKKALLISVGTGTREGAEDSLAGALSYCIEHHNPDHVFFVVTRQSKEKTLPRILERIRGYDHEAIEISSADDVQQIYEELEPRVKEIFREYDVVAVDFTSGTKAMSVAMVLLAVAHEADELSYITGKRANGVVLSGTEKPTSVKPYFATLRQRIRIAEQFFNKAQYDAAAEILEKVLRTKDPEIREQAGPLLELSKAYSLWDRFYHMEAFELIKNLKIQGIEGNKEFLGRLKNEFKMGKSPEKEAPGRAEGSAPSDAGFPEPYLIADLINNAERRVLEGNKYDDAVARLYRTVELLAQFRLRKAHGISTSSVRPEQVPRELLAEWGERGDAPIKIGLEKSYRLLKELGDSLGSAYYEDGSIKWLLQSRNNSILAHGLSPVERSTYEKLLLKTKELASTTVEDLEGLIDRSRFIKWPSET